MLGPAETDPDRSSTNIRRVSVFEAQTPFRVFQLRTIKPGLTFVMEVTAKVGL